MGYGTQAKVVSGDPVLRRAGLYPCIWEDSNILYNISSGEYNRQDGTEAASDATK